MLAAGVSPRGWDKWRAAERRHPVATQSPKELKFHRLQLSAGCGERYECTGRIQAGIHVARTFLERHAFRRHIVGFENWAAGVGCCLLESCD